MQAYIDPGYCNKNKHCLYKTVKLHYAVNCLDIPFAFSFSIKLLQSCDSYRSKQVVNNNLHINLGKQEY
jgi:hypothetical protein